MKKLVLLLAVAFSVSLFSCGGDKAADATADTTAAPVEVEVTETEVEVAPVDSNAAVCDTPTVATEAPATAE